MGVRQRPVGRPAGVETEGQTHELGAHVVEARGLDVERKELGGAQQREPALERIPVAEGLVVALYRGTFRHRRNQRRRACRSGRQICLRSRLAAFELPQQPAQLEPVVQLAQLCEVRGFRRELAE